MIDADGVDTAADHLDRAQKLLEIVAQQYDDQSLETELGEASDRIDNVLGRLSEEGAENLDIPIAYMSREESGK